MKLEEYVENHPRLFPLPVLVLTPAPYSLRLGRVLTRDQIPEPLVFCNKMTHFPALVAPGLFLGSIACTSALQRLVVSARRSWTFAPPSVVPRYVSSPSYSSSESPSSLLAAFKEDGFALIPAVLTADECDHAISLLWDYVEAASNVKKAMGVASPSPPVSRSDPDTWHSSASWPACLEGGILPYYGSGQSSCAWFVRTRPAVRAAFSSLWSSLRGAPPGAQPMSTSFDGLLMWRSSSPPPEAGWFHIDQCPLTKPGFAMVQGLVNLVDATQGSGGNVMIRGSHEVFPGHYMTKHYADRASELKGEDWFEFDGEDPVLLKWHEEGRVVRLGMRKGDLLLWDSRTVHCSYPPEARGEEGGGKRPEIVRAAALVAMCPRDDVPARVREGRRKQVEAGMTATHWPQKGDVALGAEQEEQVALEKERVRRMRSTRENVILDFRSLPEGPEGALELI